MYSFYGAVLWGVFGLALFFLCSDILIYLFLQSIYSFLLVYLSEMKVNFLKSEFIYTIRGRRFPICYFFECCSEWIQVYSLNPYNFFSSREDLTDCSTNKKSFPIIRCKPVYEGIPNTWEPFVHWLLKLFTLFLRYFELYIYIYIYIYIVTHRQTASFYQNSSVWLNT